MTVLGFFLTFSAVVRLTTGLHTACGCPHLLGACMAQRRAAARTHPTRAGPHQPPKT